MSAPAEIVVPERHSRDLAVAAAWMTSDALMFSVMNLLVRINLVTLDPKVALAFRYVFAVPIVFAAIQLIEPRSKRPMPRDTPNASSLRLRILLCACTSLISNVAWYEAMRLVSLSIATTVFYTKGLFLVLLTAILFRERIKLHHVVACLCGFAGVIFITGLEGDMTRGGVIYVLIAALTSALMILQIKSLSAHISPLRLVLALTGCGAPLAVLIAVPVWTWPTLGAAACLAAAALLSVGIHVAIANAYKRSHVASLAPFDFLRLVFVLILEFLFIGLQVSPGAWMGAALILAGVVFNTMLERKRTLRNRS